jgi:hypothetical protein
LDPQRLESLQKVFTAIFYSKEAEHTFAQVIDGLPTKAAWMENQAILPKLPEILERDQPTESSVARFIELRAEFQLANLSIPSKVVNCALLKFSLTFIGGTSVSKLNTQFPRVPPPAS